MTLLTFDLLLTTPLSEGGEGEREGVGVDVSVYVFIKAKSTPGQNTLHRLRANTRA
jgi:hypothetical protein